MVIVFGQGFESPQLHIAAVVKATAAFLFVLVDRIVIYHVASSGFLCHRRLCHSLVRSVFMAAVAFSKPYFIIFQSFESM